MGIDNLWKLVDPIKKSQSLLLYAIKHRQEAEAAGEINPARKVLTLGVDMGIWIGECNAGSYVSKSAYSGQKYPGGPLYIFFKRLTELAKLPIFFLFVFDGPNRPARKRNHRVVPQSLWWEEPAVRFIKAFGYEAHYAPGEAEAELASFQDQGYIDGIITDDGDACVFGEDASIILRKTPDNRSSSDDEYDIYDFATQASDYPDLPLSKGSTLLIALLCGGDYDNGIKGCGQATARALALCGFGDMLRDAFLAETRPAFEQFLTIWRDQLRTELQSNRMGFLSTTRKAQLTKLSLDIVEPFPSYDIISLYVFPNTSWAPAMQHIRFPSNAGWVALTPSVRDIAYLCMRFFYWNDPRQLKNRFEEFILEGLCLQMIYSPVQVQHVQGSRSLSTSNGMQIDVVRVGYERRTGQYGRMFGPHPQPKMQVSTTKLLQLMNLSTGDVSNPSDSITFFAPAYFVNDIRHIAPTEAGSLRHRSKNRRKGKESADPPPPKRRRQPCRTLAAMPHEVTELIMASSSAANTIDIIDLTATVPPEVIDLT